MSVELHVYGVDPRTIEADILALPEAPRDGLFVYGTDFGILLYIDGDISDIFRDQLHTLFLRKTLEEAVRLGMEPLPSESDHILEELVAFLRQHEVISLTVDGGVDPIDPPK